MAGLSQMVVPSPPVGGCGLPQAAPLNSMQFPTMFLDSVAMLPAPARPIPAAPSYEEVVARLRVLWDNWTAHPQTPEDRTVFACVVFV